MQPLSPSVFALLSSLVEEHAGLHYAPSDVALFGDKISSRLTDLGFDSPLDYYYYLRYDPRGEAELVHLLDVLVVGETYLFREVEALTASIQHVLRPAIEERRKARIWSAGCSTGEEPFTLAMLLASEGLLSSVEIVATDISERSIRRAREGVVNARSLRALKRPREGFVAGFREDAMLPPPWIHAVAERWLTPLAAGELLADAHGQARVDRFIVDAIDFQRGSILAPGSGTPPEHFDLVLCRNVLIYFDDERVRLAVSRLAERLRPGGKLLVGTAESLLRFGTMLRCDEASGSFFYTKTESLTDGGKTP